LIQDDLVSASINREDSGSGRPIFSKTLCPSFFLFWQIAMSLFFFVQWRKERERMEMTETADASHRPLSYNFSLRDDLVMLLQFL